jgi:hypothetical protein
MICPNQKSKRGGDDDSQGTAISRQTRCRMRLGEAQISPLVLFAGDPTDTPKVLL